MSRSHMSGHEVQDRVYRAITQAVADGRCAPTFDVLASICGCGRYAIEIAIGALEVSGQISRIGSRQQRGDAVAALGAETAKPSWRPGPQPVLSPWAQAIMMMLTDAASRSRPAPSRGEMRAALERQGLSAAPGTLSYAIRSLTAAGLITVSGAQTSRMYRVTATGQCTAALGRRARPRRPAALKPAPQSQAAPACSYDLNLRHGSPIRISGPSDAQRVFRSIGAPAALVSLTGCSAAECV